MEDFETATILSVEELSETVRSYRITHSCAGSFVPGQFVMLDLPIESEFTTRSYSIASAPNEEGWIELCIVLKPDGAGSQWLFEHAGVGTQLRVSPPNGKFVADQFHEEAKVFVCTGTGVAPFRSMIRNWRKSGPLPFPVYLVFGNRYEGDILYRGEWELLAREDPNFHFIPVLSRDTDWLGGKGYVHEHYLPLAEQNPGYQFYLCGWSNMVREAKNRLKELGFSRKLLKFELYD